jgi:membrane protease YdiL (CAAX protease family)
MLLKVIDIGGVIQIFVFYILLPLIIYSIQPYIISKPLWQGAILRYTSSLLILSFALLNQDYLSKLHLGENALKSIQGQIYPTALSSLIITIFFCLCRKKYGLQLYKDPYFFLIYPISVVAQRIIYGSYISLLLDQIGANNAMLIIVPSFLFALMHIVYRSLLVLPGTFIMSLIWQFSYIENSSLWGAIVGHLITGSLASFYYLIPFPNKSWKII